MLSAARLIEFSEFIADAANCRVPLSCFLAKNEKIIPHKMAPRTCETYKITPARVLPKMPRPTALIIKRGPELFEKAKRRLASFFVREPFL